MRLAGISNHCARNTAPTLRLQTELDGLLHNSWIKGLEGSRWRYYLRMDLLQTPKNVSSPWPNAVGKALLMRGPFAPLMMCRPKARVWWQWLGMQAISCSEKEAVVGEPLADWSRRDQTIARTWKYFLRRAMPTSQCRLRFSNSRCQIPPDPWLCSFRNEWTLPHRSKELGVRQEVMLACFWVPMALEK